MNIGDFYFAKIFMSYNNHIYSDKSYKYRPVLIIGKKNKYYQCIPITSQLSDYAYNRVDVFTDYNFPKHSQIECGTESLVLEENFGKYISTCNNEDFEYIIKKHLKVKKENIIDNNKNL